MSRLCLLLLAVFTLSSFFLGHSKADNKNDDDTTCPCAILPKPGLWKKELTARWMVHTLNWGVLSTISSRLPNNVTTPFGNVYSFIDGDCHNSTGTPYFFGTFLDQTFQDMQVHDQASFTLSEAGLASVCGAHALPACAIAAVPPPSSHHNNHPKKTKKTHHIGDPESPICARLVLTGRLVQVHNDTAEFAMARQALFHRHPQMAYWPADHDWVIAKLLLADIWLIDYFGGPAVLPVDEYFRQKL